MIKAANYRVHYFLLHLLITLRSIVYKTRDNLLFVFVVDKKKTYTIMIVFYFVKHLIIEIIQINIYIYISISMDSRIWNKSKEKIYGPGLLISIVILESTVGTVGQ